MRYSGSNAPLMWYQKVWMTLDDPNFSKLAFIYAQFSLVVIVVSTLSFCLETELNCDPLLQETHAKLYRDTGGCEKWETAWKWLEQVAVYIFTAELILRAATVPAPLSPGLHMQRL